MRTSLLVGGTLLCLGLGGAARADEPVVLQDAWAHVFDAGRKVGFAHERLTEQPGAPGSVRFVLVDDSTLFVSDGEVTNHVEQHLDAAGRVLRWSKREDGPWGRTVGEAIRKPDGGLHYRLEIRDLPACEGDLDDAWSATIAFLLVRRGVVPPGKREVPELDLPGDGLKAKTYEMARDPEGKGWRSVRDSRVEVVDGKGGLVRLTEWRIVTLPAKDEAAARDRAARSPDPAPTDPDWVEAAGVGMRRPGPDWLLMDDVKGELPTLGVIHPSGAGAAALVLPIRLPADAQARVRLAEKWRQGMNEQKTMSFTLGEPRSTTWRDHAAIELAIGGTYRMVPVVGRALLIDASGSAAFLIQPIPADLAERLEPLNATAWEALVPATGQAEATWTRTRLPRLSLELPGSWERPPTASSFLSPSTASRVVVSSDRLAAGADLLGALDSWVRAMKENEQTRSLEVVRRDTVVHDGRDVYCAIVKMGIEVPKLGTVQGFWAGLLFAPRRDGTYDQILVIASDLDWDLPGLKRVLESVRWVEDH